MTTSSTFIFLFPFLIGEMILQKKKPRCEGADLKGIVSVGVGNSKECLWKVKGRYYRSFYSFFTGTSRSWRKKKMEQREEKKLHLYFQPICHRVVPCPHQPLTSEFPPETGKSQLMVFDSSSFKFDLFIRSSRDITYTFINSTHTSSKFSWKQTSTLSCLLHVYPTFKWFR